MRWPLSRLSVAAALTAALVLGAPSGLLSRPVRAQEQAPPPPAPPSEAEVPAGAPGAETGARTQSPSAGGRQLQLPDISLIGNFVGHVGNDKRDPERDRLRLDEVEIGIQSYVYPGIRADAFIVFADDEAVVEEGFLTVQNLGRGLSAQVGRRKVPFGRVNQLHPHSWLYTVQPYVLSNLVSGESLTGDGAYLSYLLPTGRLFAQLDAGFWSQSESGEDFEAEVDPSNAIVTSPGAGIADRFQTLRLWTAAEALGGSLELGGSLARGRGVEYQIAGDDGGDEGVFTASARRRRGRQVGDGLGVKPMIQLSGLDLTYRRAGAGASRFLLRGEYVRHRQKDGGFARTVDGYYVLADQRFGPFRSLGLRYDWSQFPFAPGLHESGVSLIGTQQLTEQTYLRVQLIRGNRPGKRNFTEAWFQWVWGVGPHTHTLE